MKKALVIVIVILMSSDAGNVVILTQDPTTGELTQKVVSADEIDAVVKQHQKDNEVSAEDTQFQIVEGEDQQVTAELDTARVNLSEEQLMSSQM